MLTRAGGVFRLAFPYDATLVAVMRTIPFAVFDSDSRTWQVPVCAQSVTTLRSLHQQGYTDVAVDDLLHTGEQPAPAKEAILTGGTTRRPFTVRMAGRDDLLYQRLRSVPGARWEKERQAFSFPSSSAGVLASLVDRGLVDDPGRILTPADTSVLFDAGSGEFTVRGDARAAENFRAHFPHLDVVAAWRARGLDVGFTDPLSAEVYASELARYGSGAQPEGLQVDLYDYQRVDVDVLLHRSGALLASEPGTGKTAVAVAVGHELVTNRREVPRVVVVVPGAVRSHWKSEIIRFTGCEPTDVVVIDGDKKKRYAGYDAAYDARWLVVHYDVLHTDYDRIAPLVDGALLIADEAHRLKSPTAKRTKAARQLATRASRRLGLSGTPIENDPGEWYSVMGQFCLPGLFGSPVEFLSRYSYPGRFGGFEGARNLDELRRRSLPHLVRRRKADVAEHLPPLRVKTVTLDPDPAYAAALKRAHRLARDEIATARIEAGIDTDSVEELEAGAEMTAVGMLRLLCCSPRLVSGSDSAAAQALAAAGLVPDADGPKLDYLRELAEQMQAADERLVVFSSSRRMIELVADTLRADGIRVVTYTGKMSTSARDAAVEAFCSPGTPENPAPTVFASTDAGAEGLNLGRECTTLVNLDLPWTASRAWQRANRIHRVDVAKKGYLVINLVLRGTLEDGILRMIEAKADLADALFGESDGRVRVSGRKGRNLYTQALTDWSE